MKIRFKFIYDTGDIYYEDAVSKSAAIYSHCRAYAVSKEWVLKNCKIEQCKPEKRNEGV